MFREKHRQEKLSLVVFNCNFKIYSLDKFYKIFYFIKTIVQDNK